MTQIPFRLALLLSLTSGLVLSCTQDQSTGEDEEEDEPYTPPDDGDDGSGGGGEDFSPVPIEPAAIGIEYIGGYIAETQELTYYFYQDTDSFYNPRVEITITDVEYFSLSYDDPERENHYCTFYANYTHEVVTGDDVPQGRGFNYTDGSGGTSARYDLEFFADGSIEIYGNEIAVDSDGDPVEDGDGYLDKPVCQYLLANGYPDLIDGMHLGLGFGELSSYLEEEYWENFEGDLAEYANSTLGMYIAINHPDPESESGFSFHPYDWSSARFWEGTPTELTVTPEEGEPYNVPAMEVMLEDDTYFIPESAGATGFVTSSTYWFEDYPNIDFDLIKLR